MHAYPTSRIVHIQHHASYIYSITHRTYTASRIVHIQHPIVAGKTFSVAKNASIMSVKLVNHKCTSNGGAQSKGIVYIVNKCRPATRQRKEERKENVMNMSLWQPHNKVLNDAPYMDPRISPAISVCGLLQLMILSSR